MRMGRWVSWLLVLALLSGCASAGGDRRPAGGALFVAGGLAFGVATYAVEDAQEDHLRRGMSEPGSVEPETFAKKQRDYADWIDRLSWTRDALLLTGVVTLVVWLLSPDEIPPQGLEVAPLPQAHPHGKGAPVPVDPEQDDEAPQGEDGHDR